MDLFLWALGVQQGKCVLSCRQTGHQGWHHTWGLAPRPCPQRAQGCIPKMRFPQTEEGHRGTDCAQINSHGSGHWKRDTDLGGVSGVGLSSKLLVQDPDWPPLWIQKSAEGSTAPT